MTPNGPYGNILKIQCGYRWIPILFSFSGVDDNWGNDENQSLIPKDDNVSTYKETREQLLAEQDKVSF